MIKYPSTVCTFLAICSIAAAQEPGSRDSRASGADDSAVVEVYFATEHVPSGVKPGMKVHLLRVNGKTVTPTGIVSYVTSVLATDIELVALEPVEKPKTPEQAVRGELRVTKPQAAAIERAKAQFVTVTEASSDGTVKTSKKPVTFRLEPSKS